MIIAMGVGRRQLIGLSFSYHFLSLPPTFIYFPTRHCILLLVFRLAFRRLADFAMRPDGVVVVWTTFTGLKDVQTVMQNESKIKGGVKEKWTMCEHLMTQMRENGPSPKEKVRSHQAAWRKPSCSPSGTRKGVVNGSPFG